MTGQPFDMAVTNRDDHSSNLYLGKSNTLVATLTSSGLSDPGGDAYLEIGFDAHLEAGAVANTSVTAPGFDVARVEARHLVSWTLTPHGRVPQPIPDHLAITLSDITPTDPDVTSTVLTFTWSGLTGADDGSRQVSVPVDAAPSSGLVPLALDIDFCDIPSKCAHDNAESQRLYTSTGQPRDLSNAVAFSIRNPGNQPLAPAEGQPKFYLSMVTVTSDTDPGRYDALCTADEAKAALCYVVGDAQSSWTAAATPDDDLRWVISPPPGILGAHEAVVIVLRNIVTTLPEFPTGLLLSTRAVRDHLDGDFPLDVQKVAADATIKSFDYECAGKPDEIAACEPVTLTWDTFGAVRRNEVTLAIKETGQIVAEHLPDGGSYPVQIAEPRTFTVSIDGPRGEIVQECPVPVAPVGISLSAQPPGPYAPGAAVTVTAKIACATSVDLEPDWRIPDKTLPGSATLTKDVQLGHSVTVTATATGYQGPQPATLALTLPRVLAGSGFYMAMDGGIWRLNPDLSLDRIVVLDETQVTTIFEFDPALYWGQLDTAAVFHAPADGSGSTVEEPVTAHVRALCGVDLGYAGGGPAALLGDQSLVYNPLAMATWNRLCALGVPGEGLQMAASGLDAVISAPAGIYVANFEAGTCGRVGSIAANAVGVVLPNAGQGSPSYSPMGWLDGTNGALREWTQGSPSPNTLCTASPVPGSCLALDTTGDLFWLEAVAGGGTALWRYSQTDKNRHQMWTTPHAARTLTAIDVRY